MNLPHIIDFPVFGSAPDGFLSFAETDRQIPFKIKRVYWVYGTENNTLRGDHAHKRGKQVLIAFGGSIEVFLTNQLGEEQCFILSGPEQGLYLPCNYWRKVIMSEKSILVCLASEVYDSGNYITDFNEFLHA